MDKIVLPIDTKSLYFNIKNDNSSGHTATVATPLKKIEKTNRLDNILNIKNHEIDISDKPELIDLLSKHSKTKVLIKNVFVFEKITVNGIFIKTDCAFGLYIKEEVDESKVQYGRLKLHYPSKFVYDDEEININNKEIFNKISNALHDYAFLIRAFEYYPKTDTLNFDALIVGENSIPYSKVFIIEKGAGNKFNLIFNENADDYDREIISLKSKYGEEINPNNYLDYFSLMKTIALKIVKNHLDAEIDVIYEKYPYSIFDFTYSSDGIKQYGILRVTSTKNAYFNLSLNQQLFLMNNSQEASIFMVVDVFKTPKLIIFKYDDLLKMKKTINSIKYEGE